MNELVTNTLKYAFPGKTKGTVMVTLKRVPGEFRLTAADDGKGIIRDAPTPGWVAGWSRGFALQLGGQIERETSSQRTTVRLILPWRADSVSTGRE